MQIIDYMQLGVFVCVCVGAYIKYTQQSDKVPKKKFDLSCKINQQPEWDFLMLHCCSNKHEHTHAHTYTDRGMAGVRECKKIKTVYKTQSKRQQEKVGAAYFLYKLMLRLTVETCNKNDDDSK